MIHISQEEISSRLLEVIARSLIKTESLGLLQINIHVVTCNHEYTVHRFKQSGIEKVSEFYKTDESIKLATGGCIFFTVIPLILFYVCSFHF